MMHGPINIRLKIVFTFCFTLVLIIPFHLYHTVNIFFLLVFPPLWRCGPTRAMTSSFLRFLDHKQRRTTVGRTPLGEWLASRRDLYLTTHNTHNRQTSMPPVEFEPTISACERPQTHALDRAATGTGLQIGYRNNYIIYPGTHCIYSLCNKSFLKINSHI